MDITAALAADLAILTEALDGSRADLAEALRQLTADVRLAVPSYVGLTVAASAGGAPLNLTALEPFADPADAVTSLLMPLSDDGADGRSGPLVAILYAGRPGAFVDLAADLSWLTGRPLTDFEIDGHLPVPAPDASGSVVRSASLINQAIGVLIGRGYTPEDADREIDARATAAGHTRVEAADTILTELAGGDPGPILDG